MFGLIAEGSGRGKKSKPGDKQNVLRHDTSDWTKHRILKIDKWGLFKIYNHCSETQHTRAHTHTHTPLLRLSRVLKKKKSYTLGQNICESHIW